MASTRDIKKRLKAVDNIKRITRTMQLIATSKFQAALRRATQTKPYTEQIARLVAQVSEAAGDVELDHPLLQPLVEPAGRELLLVISSNRGLCGGYNANILRTATGHLNDHPDTETQLAVAGRKGSAFFRFAGRDVTDTHNELGDPPAYDRVNAIAADYIERFSAGQFDAIRIAYMRFESASRQTPQLLTLLPLQRPTADDAPQPDSPGRLADYEFSPDPQSILAELLPVTVKTQLFQCFNDATVSEQVARMVAMKAATDNAGEMGRLLTRQYNRARQAQITTELSEIVTGAEALK
ncbi:MAG: ATP synthase F1 subunit gamma [Planctomycetaceae bacterium]|nr:ATP synthase F1 subunit gamma [Planctomycetaceae bacterium]